MFLYLLLKTTYISYKIIKNHMILSLKSGNMFDRFATRLLTNLSSLYRTV